MATSTWTFDTIWFEGDDPPDPSYVLVEDFEEGNLFGKRLKVILYGNEVMNLEATLDQWGTWYDINIIQRGFTEKDGTVHEHSEAGFTHAQEWEMGSFMRALSEAFKYLAETAESETKLGEQTTRILRERNENAKV